MIEILQEENARLKIQVAQLEHDLLILLKSDRRSKTGRTRPATKVQAEAEQFVDDWIKKHNTPPSYYQVAKHFGIAKTAAYHRLRYYRHIMTSMSGSKKYSGRQI